VACSPYTGIWSENVAKIQPSSSVGAGAPSPGSSAAGESSAPTQPATAPLRPHLHPTHGVHLPPFEQQSPPVNQYSPSTVNASPQHTPGPSAANGYVDAPARQPESTRMRASIACARCRQSKVKCNNKGNNTACVACRDKNVACVYSDVQFSSPNNIGHSRRESSTGEFGVSAFVVVIWLLIFTVLQVALCPGYE
jgi:hypothetical protein